MKVEMRSVLYALALGDGHVTNRQGTYKKPKAGGGFYEYKRDEVSLNVLHGTTQKAYCEWKAKLLSVALGGKKVNVTKVRNGPGLKYWAYRFSKSDNYFRQIRRHLYIDGVKQFTRPVLDMLRPNGIAIWYMDDGSARRNVNKEGYVKSVSTDIATCCTESEAILICDWFKDSYGIEWKVYRGKRDAPDNKAYSLRCNTQNSRKFAALIMGHVPKCMLYKLAHVADLTSQERQTLTGICSECTTSLYGEPRRGGLCSRCYSNAYNAMNKERITETRHLRESKADPEIARETLRKWRAANPEKYRAQRDRQNAARRERYVSKR